MDHQKIKELIFPYSEGELNEEEKKQVERHLKECSECQKEFEEIGKFEEVMGKMKLKKPPKEAWKMYWSSVYNRLERRIGWILFSIGAIIILFFGGYKLVEGLIQASDVPIFFKIAILSVLGGVVILLVSLVREQLFVRKRERYKEVEK
jgi:predicted anti-sigma-YlaC factor YlaD